MTAVYDWLAQTLVSAPIPVQLFALLVVVLPACAVAAIVLLRAIDVAAVGFRRRGGSTGTGAPGRDEEGRE